MIKNFTSQNYLFISNRIILVIIYIRKQESLNATDSQIESYKLKSKLS